MASELGGVGGPSWASTSSQLDTPTFRPDVSMSRNCGLTTSRLKAQPGSSASTSVATKRAVGEIMDSVPEGPPFEGHVRGVRAHELLAHDPVLVGHEVGR